MLVCFSFVRTSWIPGSSCSTSAVQIAYECHTVTWNISGAVFLSMRLDMYIYHHVSVLIQNRPDIVRMVLLLYVWHCCYQSHKWEVWKCQNDWQLLIYVYQLLHQHNVPPQLYDIDEAEDPLLSYFAPAVFVAVFLSVCFYHIMYHTMVLYRPQTLLFRSII